MNTRLLALLSLLFLVPIHFTRAAVATWDLDPTNGDWNTAVNWTPDNVPDRPNDTAVFGVSNTTDVFLSLGVEIKGIVFNEGASAFAISVPVFTTLVLDGSGITNNSTQPQNFVAGRDTTTAGNAGRIIFFGHAAAGTLTTFTAEGGAEVGHIGGEIFFNSSSSAADGTFILEGATIAGAFSSSVGFGHFSTAADATLIANGGSGGGEGGLIQFVGDSAGGNARAELSGNGRFDLSFHSPPGMTIGSVEGNGTVFLGRDNLAVGNNNLSTTFSGTIQDGGAAGGTNGSLTKIGRGRLILTNANTYTGGTTITGGRLVVNNESGSGTGSGPVELKAGTLAGKGTIAGAVTIGTGTGTTASLAPGQGGFSIGTLTIQSQLIFNSDATYSWGLNTNSATADEVVANGVTINSGALLTPTGTGSTVLESGTVFTVINNTAATPIVSTFTNLADGSTITIGANTFQADYEGGDGNDLTLTVVP